MSTVKWVARRPPEAMSPPPPRRRPPTPTPRYHSIPRWGLQDRLPDHRVVPLSRLRRWGQQLPTILLAAGALSAVAALMQLWRYSIVLRNRSAPVGATEASIATGGMWTMGVLSVVAMIIALLAFVGWLRDCRERVFTANHLADPRPRWQLLVGVLVPVLNWFWPLAFVLELRNQHDDLPARRTGLLLRVWWFSWLVTNLLTVITVVTAWRATGLQWQANAVFLAILANLAAAGFAFLTRWMVTHLLTPTNATVTRWVMA